MINTKKEDKEFQKQNEIYIQSLDLSIEDSNNVIEHNKKQISLLKKRNLF